MRRFLPLLALLLFAGLAFPAWNQSVTVRAVDLDGRPVGDALVSIAYQQFNAINTAKDGLAAGRTDGNGLFHANLSDAVSGAYENMDIDISLSTYYWDGEKKTIAAGASGAQEADFTAPYRVQQTVVTIYDNENWTMENASVTITGTDLKKTTGIDGIVRFSLPDGTALSGIVFYNNSAATAFSAGSITADGSTRTLDITIPFRSPRHDINATKHGSLMLEFLFTEKNGAPLASQPVSFSYLGATSTATTDSSGRAKFAAGKSGTLQVSLQKNNFTYVFPYEISIRNGTKTGLSLNGTSINFTENGTDYALGQTLPLYTVLSISSFSASGDGNNCFDIYANVSDPRVGVPIRVEMSKATLNPPSAFSTMQTSLDDRGLYQSRLCIGYGMQVRVSASNKYESNEAYLNLTYVAPPPPQPPPKPPDYAPQIIAGACALSALIAIVLFYVYGRKNAALNAFLVQANVNLAILRAQANEHVIRPISEYLRLLQRSFRGKQGL